VKRLGARELAAYLEQHQPALIDVREPWEFGICHLDGSELIPMARIPGQLQRFQAPGEYVIICHHGIRSLQVQHYLARQGITATINLDGGIEAWAREVDPRMATY
jgi:rhodanese-related sulfurtransferase